MQVTELRENNHQRQVFNQQFLELKKYMAKQEDHAYFVTTYSIDQSSDIFTLHRDLEFSNMMEIGSWASFSALDTQKLKKLGVKEQNMEQAILRNKDCYVVSSVSVDYMDRYFSWKYGEAYGGKTLVDRQNYGGADFFIYKFTLKE